MRSTIFSSRRFTGELVYEGKSDPKGVQPSPLRGSKVVVLGPSENITEVTGGLVRGSGRTHNDSLYYSECSVETLSGKCP